MKKFNKIFKGICYGVAVLGAYYALTTGNDGYLFLSVVFLILSGTVTFQNIKQQ